MTKFGKPVTVPNQSMSLAEIIKRFTRGESLPVDHNEGTYETRFGDLDALKRMDVTERMDVLEDVREYSAKSKTLLDERDAAEKLRLEKEEQEKLQRILDSQKPPDLNTKP